jgi:hypothetical protein
LEIHVASTSRKKLKTAKIASGTLFLKIEISRSRWAELGQLGDEG